jgi:hypothetical protein
LDQKLVETGGGLGQIITGIEVKQHWKNPEALKPFLPFHSSKSSAAIQVNARQ